MCHILLDVLEVKRHEGIDPLIFLDQAILCEPRSSGRGGENIVDRFGNTAG
jgi:hypothetical protein